MRAALTLLLFGLACSVDGSGDLPPVAIGEGRPPEMLSETGLLRWDGNDFRYNERVVPYALSTPLFTDYAAKDRAIYIPEGSHARYGSEGGLVELPIGTVLLKSFSFPADLREPGSDRRMIETRLLIHHEGGWDAWPYIWDADGQDARLAPSGDVRQISFIDADGQARTSSYLVPQRNQCQTCHERKDDDDDTFITPLGLVPRHLHREFDYAEGTENQLEHLENLGMLEGLPELSQIEPGTSFGPIEERGIAELSEDEVEAAARDYLDVNCAHCHNPRGVQGITSQLFLDRANEDLFRLGVCKRPGSAGEGTGGLEHDIVPGDPDASILIFRVETTEVGAMMPLIGRSLTHFRGVELLRAWIANMPPEHCE